MNILEAKEEIRRTAEIYLDKNEYGEYTIPFIKQRPVFMTGGPGIGKTAIVEQTASEMDIALVSCSMACHTRQSALGLSYLVKKEYGGRTWQVSEYAVSEIIAAVYEVMKESGRKEGILFLDEINCVPEALAPAVQLFLQYRTFGNRRLPEGWVVVAAGNPPEYNKMVKKFGIALLDRLKCLKVEENFSVWKAYAYEQGIHAAVLTFLERNENRFYSVSSAAAGEEYATARGWEGLAQAIRIYEKKQFSVDRKLILQYVTDVETVGEFSSYYDRFLKYREGYDLEDILDGNQKPELMAKASIAEDEERISLLELLLESLYMMMALAAEQEKVLRRTARLLQLAGKQAEEEGLPFHVILYTFYRQLQEEKGRRLAANNLTPALRKEYRRVEALLEAYMGMAEREGDMEKLALVIKKEYDVLAGKHDKQISVIKEALRQIFEFIRTAWGEGAEMHFFITALAANRVSQTFMGQRDDQFCNRYRR